MGIIDKLESVLESFMHYLFQKRAAGSLHPLEIGKALLRKLEVNRRVSVSRVYVPNSFVVWLNPEQIAEIKCMEATLVSELKGVLREKAEKDKLSFIGELEIEFSPDENLARRDIQIEAVFQEEGPEKQIEDGAAEGTQTFRVIRQDEHPFCPRLIIEEGTGPTQSAVICDGMTIGRGSDCHLQLSDRNASRVHARIIKDKERWVLKDNGSTNGTIVNGNKTAEKELHDGDRVQIGTSILRFREL